MKWIEIPGFKGMYLINKNGQVKVKMRSWITGRHGLKREIPEHIINPFLKSNGYYHINIRHDGKQSQYPIHTLLARTFIPNPENKRCINHRDGNRINNSLKNLEWATYSENNNHALKTGSRINPTGIRNGYSKPLQVVKNNKPLGIYASLKEASQKLKIQYDRLYKISIGAIKNTEFRIVRLTREQYLKKIHK